jgi:transcriptional repressor NrdR
MRCPYCRNTDTKVLETRENESLTRRRRECLKCEKRFTTYEQIEILNLVVLKKDGRHEQFDRQKLLNGMLKACEKRPVSFDTLNEVATDIETRLLNHKSQEIKSAIIGELVMRKLRKIDPVAYVRFASVYKDIADLSTLQDEVESLLSEEKSKQKPLEKQLTINERKKVTTG